VAIVLCVYITGKAVLIPKAEAAFYSKKTSSDTIVLTVAIVQAGVKVNSLVGV
jgi:hypothetical protein